MRRHVVQWSGGVGSWYTAKRILERGVAPAFVTLLFADVRSATDPLEADAAVEDLL